MKSIICTVHTQRRARLLSLTLVYWPISSQIRHFQGHICSHWATSAVLVIANQLLQVTAKHNYLPADHQGAQSTSNYTIHAMSHHCHFQLSLSHDLMMPTAIYRLFSAGHCVTFELKDNGQMIHDILNKSCRIVLTATRWNDCLYYMDTL